LIVLKKYFLLYKIKRFFFQTDTFQDMMEKYLLLIYFFSIYFALKNTKKIGESNLVLYFHLKRNYSNICKNKSGWKKLHLH
jgi:hypothetical protein